MTDQKNPTSPENETKEAPSVAVEGDTSTSEKKHDMKGAETDSNLDRKPRGPRASGGRDRKRARRGGRNDERARSEFDQKIISLRRVSRVVAGGRRFSFSAAVVAGDRKGRVGVGVGKGIDTALAMDKAFRDAKKNMVRITTTESKSIPHDVDSKYSASVIALRPSPARGIVAGSSVRTVLEMAGITDVIAKINSRSENKINNARATVDALKSLRG